jgi:acetylornithine deacetylase/succinyl-diaminopimelate desuccinylase-like protein
VEPGLDPRPVHAQIVRDWSQHLQRTQEFVRQPSISADRTGIVDMAELVASRIRELGGSARLVPTDGHPVVYGELDCGRPRTLVLYGMYDVQPVEGEVWMVPPFAGQIVDLAGHGPSIVNRGIKNQKGPLVGFLNVLDTFIQVHGRPPVNLRFVVEGEEEQGSKHLEQMIAAYQAELSQCDAVFFPFYARNIRGQVLMHLGCKGIIFMELVCQGSAWGGPTSRGIHGAQSVVIANPVWRLLHALTSMKSRDESMLIEGYQDEVSPPSADEEELVQRLVDSVDLDAFLQEHEVKRFKWNLGQMDILRKYLYDSTLNIDGISAGYTGEGSKTLVPHRAVAKVDVRLVPNMEVELTVKRIQAHLDQNGFEDIQLRVISGYPWSRTSVHDPAVQAMIETYRFHGCEPEIWPSLAGSAPFYLFTRECGLPFVMGGLGHGGNIHSPNEYATISGMQEFEESAATFIAVYAGWRPG